MIADKAMIDAWREAGVQDSKKIVDTQIIRLDAIIRETKGVVVEVCYCRTMARYNELMGRPGANLNRLLAWQHATALGDALAEIHGEHPVHEGRDALHVVVDEEHGWQSSVP